MERKSQRKCLFIRIKKVSILFVWRLKRMLGVRGLDELTSVEVGVSSFERDYSTANAWRRSGVRAARSNSGTSPALITGGLTA